MQTTEIQSFLNALIDAGKSWTTRYTSKRGEVSKCRSVNVKRQVKDQLTQIHVTENTNNVEIPAGKAICQPIEHCYPIASQFMLTPAVIQYPSGNLVFFDTDYLEGIGQHVKASLAGGGSAAGLIQLHNNKLPTFNVNNILMKVDAWGTAGGHLNLSGPEMGAPTGGGITAKDALIARGWQVLTN